MTLCVQVRAIEIAKIDPGRALDRATLWNSSTDVDRQAISLFELVCLCRNRHEQARRCEGGSKAKMPFEVNDLSH